ncbi:MAG: hypothetical protein AB1847_18470 [bacterium]
MDKKELILTTAKDLLIAAFNNKDIWRNISLNTKTGTDQINNLGDLLATMATKVKSVYDNID